MSRFEISVLYRSPSVTSKGNIWPNLKYMDMFTPLHVRKRWFVLLVFPVWFSKCFVYLDLVIEGRALQSVVTWVKLSECHKTLNNSPLLQEKIMKLILWLGGYNMNLWCKFWSSRIFFHFLIDSGHFFGLRILTKILKYFWKFIKNQ